MQEIERLLGRPIDRDGRVRVRGSVRADDEGFSLEMVLEQGAAHSERALRDPSCEEVTRAGALVIALAIDPSVLTTVVGADPGEAAPSPTPVVEEPLQQLGSPAQAGVRGAGPEDDPGVPEPPAPDTPASQREPGPPPTPRFVSGVSGHLSAGPLPSVAPGGGLFFGVGYDALELTLGAYAIAPQEGRLSGLVAGGTVGFAAGSLRGCAAFEVAEGLLEVLPCASFELGATWATGVGVPIVRTGLALFVALGAGARLRLWFIEEVGLEALAELQVPLLRAPFVLTLDGERREFHRASEVGAMFGLGVVFRVR